MSVKVAIVVLTYNHEKYIEKAIQSILNQKVNFSLQIIVADDGSQDNTIEIISDLKTKYPDKIMLLQHENNQGVLKNILRIIPELNSEYFAILDGDDCWEYDLKLQKQTDFLDQNNQYNGIFHDAQIVHVEQAEKILFQHKKYYSQSYTFNEVIFPIDILSRNIILPSSSALLRISALKQVNPVLLTDNYSLLWKITCFLVKDSKFYFINEPWSIYNNHKSGISKSNNNQFHLSHIKFFQNLLKDGFYSFYAYEIYVAMSNEYKILLNQKQDKKLQKKLLRFYFSCELRKLWNFRKRIKAGDL